MSTNPKIIRRRNKKIRNNLNKGNDLNNRNNGKHSLDGKVNPNSRKEQMKVKNNMRSNLQISDQCEACLNCEMKANKKS